MEITKFESGAIRSTDANSVAYHLISPIGLRRLAKIANYKTDLGIPEYLNEVLAHSYSYLAGERLPDHLASCALYLCEAMRIEEQEKRYYYVSKFKNEHMYVAIPHVGLKRIAKTYAEGAKKYGDYNWEMGMPLHDLLNHAIKHIQDYLNKKEDEDHLAHAAWGYIAAMHSEELWPHLNSAFLRGPNCSLTEAIKSRLIEERKNREKLK